MPKSLKSNKLDDICNYTF